MALIDFNPDDYRFYCDLCDTHVLLNTKHCQRCNRCAYEFDHHCVWVSNDISLHNYIEFIRMLIGLLATMVFQIILCIYTLVYIWDIPTTVEVGLMSKKHLVSLTVATLVLSSFIFLMDTYLLSFHIYLICKGMSTYKYIR